ncbi:MAG: flagellar biosynthetic protein FliR [Phycisphaerales bacterium]|nr:flagellar biosynthetic protein FliR [Phycisphaerales bacterium]
MQYATLTTWNLTLLLVLVRLGGMFAVCPVFSHPAVPKKLRYFLAIAVAMAVTGRVAAPVMFTGSLSQLVLALAGELLIGVSIGWTAGLVFVGVELGAYHIAAQMGLSLGEMFNPLSPSAPGVMRQFFGLLAIVVFMGIGGHRLVISAVLKTFAVVPLVGASPSPELFEMMISLAGVSFLLALKIAAPVLITLLLASVAMGMLQRLCPQFHILSMSLPMRAVLTLLVTAGALVTMTAVVESGVNIILDSIGSAIAPA